MKKLIFTIITFTLLYTHLFSQSVSVDLLEATLKQGESTLVLITLSTPPLGSTLKVYEIDPHRVVQFQDTTFFISESMVDSNQKVQVTLPLTATGRSAVWKKHFSIVSELIPPGELPPNENCELSYSFSPFRMEWQQYPIETIQQYSDDPLALSVLATGAYYLFQDCFCQGKKWRKNHLLHGNIRYEWTLLNGKGGFVAINDGAEEQLAFGEQVLFMPPDLTENEGTESIKIKVKAIYDEDNPPGISQSIDLDLIISIRRSMFEIGNDSINDHEIVDPGIVLDHLIYDFEVQRPTITNELIPEQYRDECEPVSNWEKGKPIEGNILTNPDELIIAYGDHVSLKAEGFDEDLLQMICRPRGGKCNYPDEETITLNDELEFSWEADKGEFLRGQNGKEVIWQAPDEEGEVTIYLNINDEGNQFDDEAITRQITIKVHKLGISLSEIDKEWLPDPIKNRIITDLKPVIYICKDNVGWEVFNRKKHINLRLKYVSREPGICINYPPPPYNNRNPDLFFDEEKNKEQWFLFKDITAVQKDTTSILEEGDNPEHSHHYLMLYSKKRIHEGEAFIRVEDYGAYGQLEAIANHCVSIPPKEKETEKHCDNNDCCEGDNTIKIPRDQNGNDIADSAIQDDGGRPPTKDEDLLEGSHQVGDGLTNYMEYRGFIVNPEGDKERRIFKRTSHVMMDIFIRNESGLPLEYFKNSQLKIGEINNQDLWRYGTFKLNFKETSPLVQSFKALGKNYNDLHPIEINYNRCKDPKHCPETAPEDENGAQHGIYLTEFDWPGYNGLTCCPEIPFQKHKNSCLPKHTYWVAINRNEITIKGLDAIVNSIPAGTEREAEINRWHSMALKRLVAHELGHAVNIDHHGPIKPAKKDVGFDYDFKFDPSWKYFIPGGEYRAVGGNLKFFLDGVESNIEEATIYDAYQKGHQTSGDTRCVMIYDNLVDGWYVEANKVIPELEGKIFSNTIVKYSFPQPIPNTYCTSKNATGWNRSVRSGNNSIAILPSSDEQSLRNLDNHAEIGNCRSQITVKSWKLKE